MSKITTKDQIKEFLEITDTTQDTLIEIYRIVAESMVFKITNNYFETAVILHNKNVSIENNIITGSGFNFLFSSFDFRIQGSAVNDGVYSIKNISDSAIETNEDLADESDVTITLTTVKYPPALAYIVALMVNDGLAGADSGKITSERLGPHSINYVASSGSYSDTVLNMLSQYYRAGCK